MLRDPAAADPPNVGDLLEFRSDRHTDKGPATGRVVGCKTTVDGAYVTVRFADSQQSFSWDDIRDDATLRRRGLWFIKAQGLNMEKEDAMSPAAKRKKFPIAYRKKWRGLVLAIENPVGSTRSGKKPDGTEWHTKMQHAYGEISGTNGVDGDPVDVFVGPNLDAPMVYVVHQKTVGQWDKYDEDKCMIGFDSEEAAKAAFLANYDDPRFLGPVTAMPVADFIRKVRATKDHPAMIKSFLVFFRQ